MLPSIKVPTFNLSNAVAALVVVIVALKFRAQIVKAFAAVPAVGPAIVKFIG
jgi:hypothetical protein